MSNDAFVLLITGPAGAGKSAAAAAWAASQTRPAAHVSLDVVREFVVAGFADPRDGWSAETDWQYRIARSNCAAMARRYVSAGITCVIDDAIFPAWERVDYAGWAQELGDTPHELIVLMPSFEVVAERNARRSGRRLLSSDLLRTIYDMMRPWLEQHRFAVIADSTNSVEGTALAIQRAVESKR